MTGQLVQVQIQTSDGKTYYRTMPATVRHPRFAEKISKDDLRSYPVKETIITAESIGSAHVGTPLWYVGESPNHFFVVEAKVRSTGLVKRELSFLAKSICTWAPFPFGIDKFDSTLCQDIEEQLLSEHFGFAPQRWLQFGSEIEIPVLEYMRAHKIFSG